jgi:hypothetical protein
MSKIALEGNASGTGTFTVASPNSNSDRTLTLPDNTGTIISTGSTGAVTSSMLASGVGGKVLQSVTASFTNLVTSSTSTGTSAPEWGSLTITPTTSGNYLLVIAQGVCQYTDACQGESSSYITYAASGVSEAVAANIMSGNETSNIRTYNPFGMTVRITTSTTNQYTIRMRANGQDVFGVGKTCGWTRNQIVVLEVAA